VVPRKLDSSSSWLTARLLLSWLVVSLPIAALGADTVSFSVSGPGEGVAEITASAPAASWGRAGAEASVATVWLDGKYNQDVLVDHDGEPFVYRVFLGPLESGTHQLRIERNARWSAPDAGLTVEKIDAGVVPASDPGFGVLAHAPILYARADTLGHFSDAPLLAWYEVLPQPDGQLIQYSFVFTNEDAGTPTPALMARWGRATDIEYVYRVVLDRVGRIVRETYQGFEHQEPLFAGKKEAEHPFLLVATPNNVFADTGATEIQYRMRPVGADLSHHSREELMDRFPWSYRLMAEELAREGKIRPFGTASPTAVGDPRNYLYLEMEAENHDAGLVAWVKLKGSPRWYSSNLGEPELAITRSGWFRTTVELPPGTREDSVEALAVGCIRVKERSPDEAGAACGLKNIQKAFFLDRDYRPRPSILESHGPVTILPGEMYSFAPSSAP
jgi:hypothetical protein